MVDKRKWPEGSKLAESSEAGFIRADYYKCWLEIAWGSWIANPKPATQIEEEKVACRLKSLEGKGFEWSLSRLRLDRRGDYGDDDDDKGP